MIKNLPPTHNRGDDHFPPRVVEKGGRAHELKLSYIFFFTTLINGFSTK